MLRSKRTRIVVRPSIKAIRVQFIDYSPEGDKIVASALSTELAKNFAWKHSFASTPAAYLTGLLAGKRAKEKGIEAAILDIGRYFPTPGGKLFASLKGVVDAGIECPFDEAMLPSEDRLMGKHLNKDLKPLIDEIKQKIVGGK